MSNDDAVWAETTDGGLLKQLFGVYPTLHDSKIVSVKIDRASDSIQMVLDYADMVGEEVDQKLSARIMLEWRGVIAFEVPLGDADLVSLDFGRRENQIVTMLETWPGVFGTVISESVEATLVQLDPGDPDEIFWLRYK